MFLLSDLQQQLKQVLLHVVLSRCEHCQNYVDSINIDTVNCSTVVPHAVVLKGHIETQEEGLSETVFRSLEEWVRTRPVVFINNSWTQLDINCGFLASEDTSQVCQSADASFINSATFIVPVVLLSALLLLALLIGVPAVVMLAYCQCRMRMGTRVQR